MRGNQSGPSGPVSPARLSHAKQRWRITRRPDVSRERVRPFGSNGAHQLLGPAQPNEIDGPAIAEQGVDAEEPGEGSVAMVDAEQVRPDKLEKIDFLGVERIDPGTLEPAGYLRTAHAEQIGQPRRRAEVDAQRLDFLRQCNGHAGTIAQQNLFRNVTEHRKPGWRPRRADDPLTRVRRNTEGDEHADGNSPGGEQPMAMTTTKRILLGVSCVAAAAVAMSVRYGWSPLL